MKKLFFAALIFSTVSLFSACNGGGDKSGGGGTAGSDSSATTGSGGTAGSTGNSDSTGGGTGSGNMTKDSAGGTASGTSGSNAGTQAVDQKTKDFVAEAATGGMMEVELGNLAQQKAQSQRVKDFGRMMVDDHTKANNDLKGIASRKNIDVPAAMTDNQKKDMDKLSKRNGADFDKAYVDMMVDDHKKDIAAFKKASGNVGDNDVKNFATNTLPTLQKHLDSIQAIKSRK